MSELMLKRAIEQYVEQGIPSDADVIELVMGRAPNHVAPRRSSRRRWGIAGGLAVALVGGGTLVAAASGNLPVHLALVTVQPAPIGSADVNPAKGQNGDDGAPPTGPGHKQAPSAVSAADAAQVFGAQLLSLGAADAQLEAIYAQPRLTLPADAKPGTPASGPRVELTYTYRGITVTLDEERGSADTPLTVDAANVNGSPALKTSQGLAPAAIETVDGSEYLVGRTVDGSTVASIAWKTAGGIIAMLQFDPGLDRQSAFVLVESVR
jgi:hypothetical protein